MCDKRGGKKDKKHRNRWEIVSSQHHFHFTTEKISTEMTTSKRNEYIRQKRSKEKAANENSKN